MYDLTSLAKWGLGVAKLASEPLRRGSLSVRVLLHSAAQRLWPPLTEVEASEAAFVALRGNIIKAIPYRQLGASTRSMAALRSESEQHGPCRVHVLEEFAGAWREVFRSEPIAYRRDSRGLVVRDLDGDGRSEVVFTDFSYGNVGGSETLSVWVPARGKVYKLTVRSQWECRAEPFLSVELDPRSPDYNDLIWLSRLDKLTRSMKFVSPEKPINLDDPANADVRWYKENGAILSGQLRIHRYPGKPSDRATGGATIATVDDGDFTWSAYFRGPVCGYDRRTDTHFVVYSPKYTKRGPTCLATTGDSLWIGTFGDGIIRYDKSTSRLTRFKVGRNGEDLTLVHSLRALGDSVGVNETSAVPVSALTR